MIAHWDEAGSGRAEAGHMAGLWTDLGAAAGTRTVGVCRIQVDPGKWSTPFHRQTGEEEIFFVLGGSGVCLLQDGAFEVDAGDCVVHRVHPSPQRVRAGVAYEEHALRAGTVVSRPAGTGIAHGLRAGPSGITFLAYGTRRPDDVCCYLRSSKVSFRGLGLIARLEDLDDDDGEPGWNG